MKSPSPTVDIIIEYKEGIALIERKFEPYGWAIPGGFVEYGESLEEAAIREAKEEISLDVALLFQLKSYSDPNRDKRRHTIATVFIAKGIGILEAADDAMNAKVYPIGEWPSEMAFDHLDILHDYEIWKKTGKRPVYA